MKKRKRIGYARSGVGKQGEVKIMKKHIIGLAIFSFIVSAAAIIYAIFNIPEIIPVYEVVSVPAPQYIPTERTHCKLRLKSKINLIEVRQAVFNWRTKQFNWELATPDVNEPIDLLFFSKDEQGARFITAERINNAYSRNGILRFSSSYDWQNKFSSFENL